MPPSNRRPGEFLSEICTVTAKVLLAALFAMLMMTPSQPAWPEEMRGLLVVGHETRSLQPRSDDRVLWVSARGAVRQQLAASVRHVTTRLYEAVYAELNGELSVEPANGFDADYDGTVEVHKVRLVSKEGIDACRGECSIARSEAAVDGEPSTYVFVCNDDLIYTVRVTGTEAWVFGPEGTHRLSIVPAEKGARYADGIFELWIEGQQAQLGETGGPLRSCRNDPRRAVWERAKLDGVDFRAVGNEPGWSLEMLEGSRMC